jgi:hypothetical protein
MSKFVLWPERTRKALVRVSALSVLLVFTAVFGYGLSRFDPGTAYFYTMTRLLEAHLFFLSLQRPTRNPPAVNTNDPRYGFSVLDEARIALASEHFFESHGHIPASLDELRETGLSPEFYVDPWKRRYRVRLLPGGVLMVQTTGPSGVDAVSPAWAESAERHLQPAIQPIGDNLVLLMKLEGR